MIIQGAIDYKIDPDVNLVHKFQAFVNDPQVIADQEKEEDANFMKQRRLLVTPTLDYY